MYGIETPSPAPDVATRSGIVSCLPENTSLLFRPRPDGAGHWRGCQSFPQPGPVPVFVFQRTGGRRPAGHVIQLTSTVSSSPQGTPNTPAEIGSIPNQS